MNQYTLNPKYPFSELSVGDSFIVCATSSQVHQNVYNANHSKRHAGKKFSTSKIADDEFQITRTQ